MYIKNSWSLSVEDGGNRRFNFILHISLTLGNFHYDRVFYFQSQRKNYKKTHTKPSKCVQKINGIFLYTVDVFEGK